LCDVAGHVGYFWGDRCLPCFHHHLHFFEVKHRAGSSIGLKIIAKTNSDVGGRAIQVADYLFSASHLLLLQMSSRYYQCHMQGTAFVLLPSSSMYGWQFCISVL
jgi:hypothetical protein